MNDYKVTKSNGEVFTYTGALANFMEAGDLFSKKVERMWIAEARANAKDVKSIVDVIFRENELSENPIPGLNYKHSLVDVLDFEPIQQDSYMDRIHANRQKRATAEGNAMWEATKEAMKEGDTNETP